MSDINLNNYKKPTNTKNLQIILLMKWKIFLIIKDIQKK